MQGIITAIRATARRIRKPLRELRHAPDRILHPWRRRRARRLLIARRPIESVVFVCLGNINRSPYAAAAFVRRIEEERHARMRVMSAGLIGPDRPASATTRELARARGLDLERHRSRLVDAACTADAHLVVVMDPRQREQVRRQTGRRHPHVLVLGDLDPVPIVRRAIQDPYGHSADVFERVYDRVDRCLTELVRSLPTHAR